MNVKKTSEKQNLSALYVQIASAYTENMYRLIVFHIKLLCSFWYIRKFQESMWYKLHGMCLPILLPQMRRVKTYNHTLTTN